MKKKNEKKGDNVKHIVMHIYFWQHAWQEDDLIIANKKDLCVCEKAEQTGVVWYPKVRHQITVFSHTIIV